MAHELASSLATDGSAQTSFAYASRPAWHGLGQQLSPTDSPEEVAAKAGLSWAALALPKCAQLPGEGKANLVLPGRALVRSDSLLPGAPKGPILLGEVSDQYHIVQPAEILAALRAIANELGATLETAGALRDGRRIFGLVRFPDDLVLGSNDRVARYASIYTSFDGSLATCLSQTSIRVVCANTLRASIAQEASLASRGLIRFTHSQESQLSSANLAALGSQWAAFARWARLTADCSLTPGDQADFAHALASSVVRGSALAAQDAAGDALMTAGEAELGRSYGQRGTIPNVDPALVSLAREAVRVETLREQLLQAQAEGSSAPGAGLDSARGSLWGAVNAATYVLGRGQHLQRRTAPALAALTEERLGLVAPRWEAALASLVDEIMGRPARGASLDDLGIALETGADGAWRAGVLSA